MSTLNKPLNKILEMNSTLTLKTACGAGILPYVDEIARLRITIFREFPYLYDGSEAYEQDYLKTYTESDDSIAVLIMDRNKLVGVSTGLPMEDEEDDFKRPFLERGYNPAAIFYCGESILEKEFRGRGIYKQFFEERESHARRLNRFQWICFCSVQRPAGHPLRPDDYRPLDHIWQTYGYEKHPELTTTYRWKDIDEKTESDKPMVFWVKELE